MKFLAPVLALFAITSAFAAPTPPATNAPPVSNTQPAPAPEPAEMCPSFSLDDYINELTTVLKLSDADKKTIEGIYVADGVQMKNLLNNDSLSPMQKAVAISGLHDARNVKIEAMLADPEQQKLFLWVEAKYRVALTELAAEKGLVATAAPAAPAK